MITKSSQKLGLKPEHLQCLLTHLQEYPSITEAIVYGSRAKGNYHQRSDLDLALKGTLDRHLIAELQLSLDETLLPMKLDLLNYNELSNPALKEHIDRVGFKIYPNEE